MCPVRQKQYCKNQQLSFPFDENGQYSLRDPLDHLKEVGNTLTCIYGKHSQPLQRSP